MVCLGTGVGNVYECVDTGVVGCWVSTGVDVVLMTRVDGVLGTGLGVGLGCVVSLGTGVGGLLGTGICVGQGCVV